MSTHRSSKKEETPNVGLLRRGDNQLRKQANATFALIGQLQQSFNVAKQVVDQTNNQYKVELERYQSNKLAYDKKLQVLAIANEKIDLDPLPEGAQPIRRIQERDAIKMVFIFLLILYLYASTCLLNIFGFYCSIGSSPTESFGRRSRGGLPKGN